MTDDLVKRLIRFKDKVCISSDLEVEAADAIERKDAALRLALEALEPFTKVDVPTIEGHLTACAALARIKEALND